MFGDFFQNFGLNDLLQQFEAARARQQQQMMTQFPFGADQVDAQGGVFGAVAGTPQGDHMAGMGGGRAQEGAGGLGAPPGTAGPEMGKPPPTGAAVAAGPMASPLAPGAGSAMAGGLDKRSDQFANPLLPDSFGGPPRSM
jgi:hypothetical protein